MKGAEGGWAEVRVGLIYTVQSGHWFLVLVFLASWFSTFLELLNSFEWLMKAVTSLPVKMHREPILCTIRGGVAVNKRTDLRLQVKNLCASSGVCPTFPSHSYSERRWRLIFDYRGWKNL